jgi:hypothetical protein
MSKPITYTTTPGQTAVNPDNVPCHIVVGDVIYHSPKGYDRVEATVECVRWDRDDECFRVGISGDKTGWGDWVWHRSVNVQKKSDYWRNVGSAYDPCKN